MLLEEFDANKTAIINPDMCVEKIENFPEVTISCFSEELFNEVLEFFRAKEIASVHSASGLNPIYEVTYKGKKICNVQINGRGTFMRGTVRRNNCNGK